MKPATVSQGIVMLGQIADRLPMLNVACNRCDRRGRLRMDCLIAEYGPNLPLPELRRIIVADCIRMQEAKMHDVCGILSANS